MLFVLQPFYMAIQLYSCNVVIFVRLLCLYVRECSVPLHVRNANMCALPRGEYLPRLLSVTVLCPAVEAL